MPLTALRTSGPPALRLVAPPAEAGAFDVACATRSAAWHARWLWQCGVIHPDEVDDLTQTLLLHAWERWPAFDPARSGPATFLSVVLRRAAHSLARTRQAAKRGGRCPVAPVCPQTLPVPDSMLERAPLRLDLQTFLARLPAPLRQLCAGLQQESKTAVIRRLGLTRGQWRACIRTIRSALVASGATLDPLERRKKP